MIGNQLCAIGYASLKDPQGLRRWLMETGLRKKSGHRIDPSHPGWYMEHWGDYFCKNQDIYDGEGVRNIFKTDSINDSWGQRETERFFSMISYLDSVEQRLSCYHYDDMACLVGYGKLRYVMPSEWFMFQPFKEYDQLTRPEFLVLGGPVAGGSLPATANGISKQKVISELELREAEAERLYREQKKIEEGATKELEPLKKQIEALQAQLKKQQDQLLAELRIKKEELNKPANKKSIGK